LGLRHLIPPGLTKTCRIDGFPVAFSKILGANGAVLQWADQFEPGNAGALVGQEAACRNDERGAAGSPVTHEADAWIVEAMR
jgi:hypothetical protein